MESRIGTVTHYFGKAGVVVLALHEELKVGESIRIHGHTTDFTQQVGSMEVDHKKVEVATPGMDVALKVADVVRRGDGVYRVAEG